MWYLKCQFDATSWSIWNSHFPSYSELQQSFQLPLFTTSFSYVPMLTCYGPEEFCRWGGSSNSREALLHNPPRSSVWKAGHLVQPPAQNNIMGNTRSRQSWLCLVRSWKISRNEESTSSHQESAPVLPYSQSEIIFSSCPINLWSCNLLLLPFTIINSHFQENFGSAL